MKKAQIKFLVFLFAFLIVLASVYALSITQIQPSGNITTSNSSVLIKYNFTISNMTNLNFSWDNTNYSLFDKSLVLFYNFDNRSSLGEKDLNVSDLSQNNFTAIPKGGIEWNETKGRLGSGGFNFTGTNYSIGTPRYLRIWGLNTSINNATNEWTASIWIYPIKSKYTLPTILVLWGNYQGWLRWDQTTNKTSFNINNFTADNSINSLSQSTKINQWSNIIMIRNYTNFSIYVNGEYSGSNKIIGNLRFSIDASHIGAHPSYPTSNYRAFNGSIDDLMVWNRSLSYEEVRQLYKVQLTKYDSTNWTLISNQSNLLSTTIINASNPTYSKDYVLCSTNLTDSICSVKKSISIFLPLKKMASIFSSLIGSIRNDFYGIASQGAFFNSYYKVDTDNDGTRETYTNKTWHREKFLESGMDTIKGSVSLSGKYSGIGNPSAEGWLSTQTHYSINKSSSKCQTPNNWFCGSYGNNLKNFSYFAQSSDAHSGSYSVNVTNNGTVGNTAFSYIYLYLDNVSHNYNISVWIKSPNITTLSAGWNDGSISACSKNTNGNGSWQQVSCSFSSNSTKYTNIRLQVSAGNGERLLWDDFQVTEDGITKDWYGDYHSESWTNYTEMYNWAYQNNITMYNLFLYTPSFLANVTENCISDYTSCNINNFTIMDEIWEDFLNRTTNNCSRADILNIEVWNEPYHTFWQEDSSYDNLTRAKEYVQLYNHTYTSIKNTCSNIGVGGPSGFRSAPNMTETFISNFTNASGQSKWDFISIHPYGYSKTNGLEQYNDVNDLINGYCATYNANCSHFVLTEYNVGDAKLQNGTYGQEELGQSFAESFESLLNHFPANITSIPYKWAEGYKYSNTAYYPEYPKKWSIVSEPNLDNYVDARYNVTKNFAHLCPAGGEVYNSTGNDTIKIVSCKSGSNYSVILINTGTESRNITINNGNKFPFFRNYETEKVYIGDTEGNFELGVLDSYDILYLVNYSETDDDPRFYGGATGIPTPEPIPTLKNETITPEEESLLDRINNKIDDLVDTANEIVPGDFKLNAWQWILVIMGIFAFIGIIVYSITYEIKNT